jgi:hypothetical protein
MPLINGRTSPRNRVSDDARVLSSELACCQHLRRTAWACLSTGSPARGGKPEIIIVRAVTSDGPDGHPWPPPDSNTLWAVVRRADGCTLWRTIHLAEVRSAAPDFGNLPKAATEGPRHDTR